MGRQRGRGSWGLAAAMLSFFLLSQAQKFTIRVKPSLLFVRNNAVLTPEGYPEFAQCIWYRGRRNEDHIVAVYIPLFKPPQVVTGPRFTGRETLRPDCSMHIRNLMLNDSDKYHLTKTVPGFLAGGDVRIRVKRRPHGKGAITAGVMVVALAGAVLIGILF